MSKSICNLIRGYKSNYIKIYYDINHSDIENGIKNGDITKLYMYIVTKRDENTYDIGYKITNEGMDTIIELDKDSNIKRLFPNKGIGIYTKNIRILDNAYYYYPILKNNNIIIIFFEINNKTFDSIYTKYPFI